MGARGGGAPRFDETGGGAEGTGADNGWPSAPAS